MNDTFDYIEIVKQKEKKRKIILISVCVLSVIAGIYLFITYQIGQNPLATVGPEPSLPASQLNPSSTPQLGQTESLISLPSNELIDSVIPTDIPLQVYPFQDSQYSPTANVIEKESSRIAEAKKSGSRKDSISNIQPVSIATYADDSVSEESERLLALAKKDAEIIDTVQEKTERKISVDSNPNTENVSQLPVSNFMTISEVMPSYPQGPKGLYRFLKKHLKYPDMAIRHEIQGKVFVQFIVDDKGNLSQFEVVRGLGYGCDEEALRVAQMMPSWKPGKQSGTPVPVLYTIPITFEIQ